MRVVAGSARGRRLVAPKGTDVRPTTDRVREAVFNALNSLGAIEGATVLDLFAGSGALGVEALSRGAAHATFVDNSAASLDAVRANLAACDLSAEATVVKADALAHLRGSGPVDLALLDPPYAFDDWAVVLDLLDAGLAVCESDRDVPDASGWSVVRRRSYGGTVVTVLEPVGPERGSSAHEQLPRGGCR